VRLKGRFKLEEVRGEFISIPFGAIKRNEFPPTIPPYSKVFQSLLVRLKVFAVLKFLTIALLFQSLLVRLKEKITQKNKFLKKNFNPFWCD